MSEFAKMIDHSILKPFSTDEDIRECCRVAEQYKVATVCVRPSDVALAKQCLQNTSVKVTTVIGFPHGTTSTYAKVAESIHAIADGAVELDVVLNIGKMKSAEYEFVQNDLQAVINTAHSAKALVKVIFETCYLTEAEIIKACHICNAIGADYVKTSTGFGSAGATIEHLHLMRKHANDHILLKASGGIRSKEDVIAMKSVGADRIGTSATVKILS